MTLHDHTNSAQTENLSVRLSNLQLEMKEAIVLIFQNWPRDFYWFYWLTRFWFSPIFRENLAMCSFQLRMNINANYHLQ